MFGNSFLKAATSLAEHVLNRRLLGTCLTSRCTAAGARDVYMLTQSWFIADQSL